MKSTSNLRISILQDFRGYRTINILIFEDKGAEGLVNYVYNNGTIEEIIIKTREDELNAKSFMTLPNEFAQFFIQGIIEYQAEKGIKTKDENLIEGKLIATELHLKDMQEFAKKLLEHIIATPPIYQISNPPLTLGK